MPVGSRPMISDWIESVPSYVSTIFRSSGDGRHDARVGSPFAQYLPSLRRAHWRFDVVQASLVLTIGQFIAPIVKLGEATSWLVLVAAPWSRLASAPLEDGDSPTGLAARVGTAHARQAMA